MAFDRCRTQVVATRFLIPPDRKVDLEKTTIPRFAIGSRATRDNLPNESRPTRLRQAWVRLHSGKLPLKQFIVYTNVNPDVMVSNDSEKIWDIDV